MGKTRVFLSLGSNLGQRKNNLEAAVARLASLLEQIRVSAVYQTKPLYLAGQPEFLNIAVSAFSAAAPLRLLEGVLGIEASLGRRRSGNVPKGPRIIDIDILLYGERVLDHPRLAIPHPRMAERQFVLIPLLELAPELKDPLSGEPYAAMLARLEDQGVYTLCPWDYTACLSRDDRNAHA